jgi:hypothetical protein
LQAGPGIPTLALVNKGASLEIWSLTGNTTSAKIIEAMVGRFSVRPHGQVLTPNDYHLIAETPAGNLSQAMQRPNLEDQLLNVEM